MDQSRINNRYPIYPKKGSDLLNIFNQAEMIGRAHDLQPIMHQWIDGKPLSEMNGFLDYEKAFKQKDAKQVEIDKNKKHWMIAARSIVRTNLRGSTS